MMLIENISTKEKEVIDSLRERAVEDNDFMTRDFCDIEKFLRFWETGKETIAAPFKDSLILKKHISINAPAEEKDKQLSALIYHPDLGTQLRGAITNAIYNAMGEKCYDAFLINDHGISFSISELFGYHIFTVDSFSHNIYKGPTFTIEIDDKRQLKFVHGMKLMKLLGRLAKFADVEELYQKVRIEQSQIINDNKLDAELCLSIHPLDYMTASYNTNDWSSCMAWNGGEYRRGVIEMMNSPYVVVAYIASEKNTICGGNWNSKRWREFFIVSRDMISGIKGYPYWNRDLEKIVLEWLKELYAPVFNVKYDNTCVWNFNEKNIRIECGPAMYNDFYGDYNYCSMFRKGLNTDDGSFKIFYSGASECIVCGEKGYFDDDGDLCCESCLEHYYCCDCGCLITSSEDLIEHNGNYYCGYCYENLPLCNYCGEKVNYAEYDSFYIGVLLSKEHTPCSPFVAINNHYYEKFGEYSPDMFYIDDACKSKLLKDEADGNTHWVNNSNVYGYYLDIRQIDKKKLLQMISKETLAEFYKRLLSLL